MRMRALIARNNELLEEIKDEHRLNREEHRLNREEHRRNREQLELNRREFASNRDVMRSLIADVEAQREEGRRHSEAMIGALTDLAAEIRSWGGGTAGH